MINLFSSLVEIYLIAFLLKIYDVLLFFLVL